MRLPLVPAIESRDGSTDKDERLTNVLKETDEGGELACLRPGLYKLAQTTGNGNGIVSFNDTLLSVYGATLLQGINPQGTVYAGQFGTTPGSFYPFDYGPDGVYRVWGENGFGGVELYESVDGIDWQIVAIGTNYGLYSPRMVSTDNFIGFQAFITDASSLTYYLSTDGVTWGDAKYASFPDLSGGFSNLRRSFRFRNYVMVSSASGFLYYTMDGVTFGGVKVPTSSQVYGGIAFGDKGVFLYGPGAGYWSSDLVNWVSNLELYDDYTSPSVFATSPTTLIGLSNSSYTNGAVWKTTNGVTWDRFDTNLGLNHTSVVWDGDRFISHARDENNVAGLYQSRNGEDWSKINVTLVTTYITEMISPKRRTIVASPTNIVQPSREGNLILLDNLDLRSLATLEDSFFDFAQSTL